MSWCRSIVQKSLGRSDELFDTIATLSRCLKIRSIACGTMRFSIATHPSQSSKMPFALASIWRSIAPFPPDTPFCKATPLAFCTSSFMRSSYIECGSHYNADFLGSAQGGALPESGLGFHGKGHSKFCNRQIGTVVIRIAGWCCCRGVSWDRKAAVKLPV